MSLPNTPKAHNSNTPSRSSKLRAALEYAARDWPVFPCRHKQPLTRSGHLDASTDPRQIHLWWNRWPDANIGIPTGERSGILALDVDQPVGLDALEAEHGQLPATRTHSTGSGGMHYLYRYPAGENIRNSAGKLAEGLDVRGEGGYIIVPPSSTSRPYELLDDIALVDTPAWLVEALRRPQRAVSSAARRITTAVIDLDGPIPAGARDDTLTSIAGRLHDDTRDLEELTGELLEINVRRCEPPLPDAQVEKIARSIHGRPPCKQSTRVSAETVEALEEIERGVLFGRDWPGMGGKSERDTFVALIVKARTVGELIPGGVRVSISVRELALMAAVSKRSMLDYWKGGERKPGIISRLKRAGLIRSDGDGRREGEAGAFVIAMPASLSRAGFHHSPTGRGKGRGGETLRAPRLRWSAPVITRDGLRETVRRLGKSCGAVIDALERAGGSATVEELAAALHKKRARDLRRRLITRLEASGVVECSGVIVAFTRDWLNALNRERARAGEIRNEKGEDGAYERDMKRHAREREAYRVHRNTKPDPLQERPPSEARVSGTIEELERVEDVSPELVEALRRYLDRRPSLRDELPSCLAIDLWKYELVEGKPTPAAVEVALYELRREAA